MAKYPASQVWSQHFFRDPALAAAIIGCLPLTHDDTVVEIGPGKGALTAPLATRAGRVHAVEIDPSLCTYLRSRFADVSNLRIINVDFLNYRLPISRFVAVGNLPFAVTTAIVTKLLTAASPPPAAYLVVQQEAAARFAGTPRETQYSILAKPWFTFAMMRTFKPQVFVPAPRVDAALLAIHQRAGPLVAPADADLYRAFVRYGFGHWRRSLKTSLRPVFSNLQFRRLADQLHIRADDTPTDLTFPQWLGLFDGFRMHVPPHKQRALVARVPPSAPHPTWRPEPLRPPLPRPPPAWVASRVAPKRRRARARSAGSRRQRTLSLVSSAARCHRAA
jgi:23S rRNA (adenine-N6)-dimethyltransferase